MNYAMDSTSSADVTKERKQSLRAPPFDRNTTCAQIAPTAGIHRLTHKRVQGDKERLATQLTTSDRLASTRSAHSPQTHWLSLSLPHQLCVVPKKSSVGSRVAVTVTASPTVSAPRLRVTCRARRNLLSLSASLCVLCCTQQAGIT